MEIITGINFPDADVPFLGVQRGHVAALRDCVLRLETLTRALSFAYARGDGVEAGTLLAAIDSNAQAAMLRLASLRAIAELELEQDRQARP